MLPALFALLVLPALPVAAEPQHYPLRYRAPAGGIDYNAVAAHLRGKYGIGQPGTSRVRRATAAISMINQQTDASYLGTVEIGTPAQNFNVVLDTGSADLWVADSSCTTCDRETPLYNMQASSSVTDFSGPGSTTTIQYGSGAVEGDLISETVAMSGFTVQQQTMLAVDRTTDSLLSGSNSGIMGLAFETIASTRAKPFWQELSDNGELDAQEMGFWMTRLRGTQNTQEEAFGGIFTLGGTNSSLFQGDIEFIDMPSNSPTFWLLELTGVTVNGNSVQVTTGDSALSAIDTGTTLIGGPTNDVNAIWDQVPNAGPVQGMDGFFAFPCDTDVQVSMAFGGQSWPIDVADMSLGPIQRGSDSCLGGIFDLSLGSNIVAGSGNPSWVVGATFLKNVYSVFRANPPSIGFAQLSDAAGGSSGSPTAGPSRGDNSAARIGSLSNLHVLAVFLVSSTLLMLS